MQTVEVPDHPVEILAKDPQAIVPQLAVKLQVESRLPGDKFEVILRKQIPHCVVAARREIFQPLRADVFYGTASA
jgi:hypothetical protein